MTRPGFRGYAIATAAVAASLLARYAFQSLLGSKVPFLQFYPAIVVAAWAGGLGPGLVATGLSSLAAMLVLLPPAGLGVDDTGDRLSLVVFAATGAFIAWLSERATRSSRRATDAKAAACWTAWTSSSPIC